MSASSRRVAIYGEIDPNLVDGSSIWLQSICQVFASLEDVEVTLLLRRPVEPGRRFLISELEVAADVDVVDSGRSRLLDPEEALDLLEKLDRERRPFDLVLLRGQKVIAEAAERASFDGRLWPYVMTGRGMADKTLRALVPRSARLLCQTEAVAEELREIAPKADGSILVLPPMIPDSTLPPGRKGKDGPLRLAYSGKLAPEYCWLETVDAFCRLREVQPKAELHVLGDKVHRPPHLPDFHEEAIRTLRETDGLRWHGAVARGEVHRLLAGCDLALSIRDPGVEGAREISTKVLEYGAAGLPVVLNRAPAYEGLLGESYPLFINGPEGVGEILSGSALDAEVRAAAAAACHAASRNFTFSRVAARLAEHLPQVKTSLPVLHPELRPDAPPVSATVMPDPPSGASSDGSSSPGGRTPRVLVAGHDLKFLGLIRQVIASTGATLAEDLWQSHTEHDETASRAALEQADIILCEWCLGNAAWYSRNKQADQRLLIRLHRMEVFTDHPAAVEIDNVDQVVCVAQHIADRAVERFDWDPSKLRVINNSVDVDRFRRPKDERSRYTLAMIGYAPERKRLDRALDVLGELRRSDPRFRLLLIGHPPSEFGWVVRRTEEVEFFRRCFKRVQNTPELRGAISFQPFTDDLPQLFQQAGFVLSTSDSEGHQVALAEGAASGAVPVILDRPGAADHYPDRWIHADARGAAVAVRVLVNGDLKLEADSAAKHATRWSRDRIYPWWLNVLGLAGSPQP